MILYYTTNISTNVVYIYNLFKYVKYLVEYKLLKDIYTKP